MSFRNSVSMTMLVQSWLMVRPLADGWRKQSWTNIGPMSKCHVHTLMPDLSGNTTLAQHWANVGIFCLINDIYISLEMLD